MHLFGKGCGMTLSPAEITKLASKAESIFVSAFDVHNTMGEIRNRVKEAISCLDTIIRNAPANTLYPYALKHAEMIYRAISWEGGVIPWGWLMPCDSSFAVLSDEEAKKLVENGNTILLEKSGDQRALCYFDTIIKYSAPTAYYFSKRADCRIGIGNIGGAVEDFTRAIELDPHQAKYYKLRAICNAALFPSGKLSGENINKLLQDYRTAMQKDPTAADVWMKLISLNMLLNDWDEVISLCGQSQSYINDHNDKALRAWILCLALTLSGDTYTEEDIQSLRESRLVHGSFIEYIINHLLEFSEDSKVQEQTKKKLLVLNTLLLVHMSDLNLSSQLCISLGLWDEALKILEQYLQQNPEDDQAWERKWEVLAKLGQLDNTYKNNPTLPKAWLGAIVSALLLGDWNEATNLCRESEPFITNPTDKADRAWYLCLALVHAGKAVPNEELINAIESKRTNGVVFNQLVQKAKDMSEESTQQIERKTSFLDILLKPVVERLTKQSQLPGESNIWPILSQKADLLSRLGRNEEELDARLLIMELTSFPGNWIKISDCFRNLSRFPEALKAAEKAMEWGPTFSEAWLAKGKCFEMMSHYKDALNAYSKAAEPNPGDYYSKDLPSKNVWAPYALQNKIALLSKLGNFREELKALDQLFTMTPGWVTINQIDEIISKNSLKDSHILSEAWFQKARLLSFNNDSENAEICLSTAIEIDPKIRQLVANEKLVKNLLPSDK